MNIVDRLIYLKFTLLIASFLCQELVVYGQQNISVIDHDNAILNLKEYDILQANLFETKEVYQDSIKRLENRFQFIYNNLFRGCFIAESEIKKLSKEVNILHSRLRNLQQKYVDEIERLKNINSEILNKALQERLEDYCTQNQLALIIDKKIVLYHNNNLDLTDDFIKFLKL